MQFHFTLLLACLRVSHGAALDDAALYSLHVDVLSDENGCTKEGHCTEEKRSLELLQRGHQLKGASHLWPHIKRRFSTLEAGSLEFAVHRQKWYHKANLEVFCPRGDLGLPSLCQQGSDHWSVADLKAALPEFIELYKRRPDVALQSPNHAFALWFTVKKLQPKYIIESGVYRGGSTWILREAAGPLTKIISMDPVPYEFVEYKDQNINTTYILGRGNFTDFANMRWSQYIPEADKQNTLVMLDDHMSAVKRVQNMLHHGFVHLWYDDNYHYGEPGQDCYSFNSICAPLAEKKGNGSIVAMDRFKQEQRLITLDDHKQNQKFLSKHVEVYYEFPPIWNGACDDTRELLHESELVAHGLPSATEGQFNYYTAHPPYVKLRP